MRYFPDVSSNPDVAVVDLAQIIIEQADEFFNGNVINGDKLRELDHCIRLLKMAIDASHYGEGEKNGMLSNANSAANDYRSKRAFIEYLREIVRLAQVSELDLKFKEQRLHQNLFRLQASELARLQGLVDEMRAFTLSVSFIDEAHKTRILRRIESLAFELRKKRGNFDVVLAAVLDIGEAVGQFGKRIKPLADRVAEIRTITQKSVEERGLLDVHDKIKLPPSKDQ